MKKKASLNLSINAIVVLILAITMLGLGLTFMRNIFGGATKEFTKVSGEVEKQMIEQMKESNKVVSLSRPKITVKVGEKEQIFIGLKNDEQNNKIFQIEDIICNTLGSSDLNCHIDSGTVIIEALMNVPIDVSGGEVRVIPINIIAGTSAVEGTCFCTVDVSAGADGESIELTIDVNV
ncbi:hypothetical protein KY313_01030 [Candidatus Woesearchaeota archaeon]|jgi:hypothetical protein|nr:hypothetical protein [Candidatus Woesearchaeota archaeon]